MFGPQLSDIPTGPEFKVEYVPDPKILRALLYADEALCAATFAKGADQSQLNHAIKLVREARKGLGET